MHLRSPLLTLPAVLLGCCLQVQAAQYTFSAEQSSIEVHVPKAGLLSFAGHEHYLKAEAFTGSLTWDPTAPDTAKVQFDIPVAHLAVLDSELKEEDRATVKEHMQAEDVLNAASYGTISFQSTKVNVSAPELWKVSGILTVAGQSADISFDVDIDTTAAAQVGASGGAKLALADFGIKPVSALAGTIKTGKTVDIDFNITAAKAE